MPGLSGVGMSFGADRIYDVLNALDLFPKKSVCGATQLMFVNFGEKETDYILPILDKARKAGIRSEIFPDAVKIKKQMNYANTKSIPYVAIVGENEIKEEKITLKDMSSGEQCMLSANDLIDKIV